MTKVKSVLDEIMATNPDAVIVKGYDDCLVGTCETFEGTRLLYSESKIINKLMDKGMSDTEALEYFENNILGIYYGAYSPVFLVDLEQS
jgi:hypothetical protein